MELCSTQQSEPPSEFALPSFIEHFEVLLQAPAGSCQSVHVLASLELSRSIHTEDLLKKVMLSLIELKRQYQQPMQLAAAYGTLCPLTRHLEST